MALPFFIMKRQKKEPELIPFKCVKVNIPRLYILRCLNKPDYLTYKERRRISQKLKQIEWAQNQLVSVKSIAEKCYMKASDSKHTYL